MGCIDIYWQQVSHGAAFLEISGRRLVSERCFVNDGLCQIVPLLGRPEKVAWRIDSICDGSFSRFMGVNRRDVQYTLSITIGAIETSISCIRPATIVSSNSYCSPKQVRTTSRIERKDSLIRCTYAYTTLITSPDRNHHASNPHAPPSRQFQHQHQPEQQQRPRPPLLDCSHAAPCPRSPSNTAW
jgi:hypothetical protein